MVERKGNALQGELEEARALLDSADRGKKQTDLELAEARTAVNEMTSINSKASAEKRHLVLMLQQQNLKKLERLTNNYKFHSNL